MWFAIGHINRDLCKSYRSFKMADACAAFKGWTIWPTSFGGEPPAAASSLLTHLVDKTLQQFDFVSQLVVFLQQAFDLAHRMQHRRVIAATKTATDFRQ